MTTSDDQREATRAVGNAVREALRVNGLSVPDPSLAYDIGDETMKRLAALSSRPALPSQQSTGAGDEETALTEALDVLAHIVAQANVNPVGDGDFIERYDMPVGSIHKAIPFLARHGIVVDEYGYVHRSGPNHEFLPVAEHPDDDECTYRSDGTDATYCGLTEGQHALASRPALPAGDKSAHDVADLRLKLSAAKEFLNNPTPGRRVYLDGQSWQHPLASRPSSPSRSDVQATDPRVAEARETLIEALVVTARAEQAADERGKLIAEAKAVAVSGECTHFNIVGRLVAALESDGQGEQ